MKSNYVHRERPARSHPKKYDSNPRIVNSLQCIIKTEWGYIKLEFSRKGLIALFLPGFSGKKIKSLCSEYPGCKKICVQLKKYFKGGEINFKCKIDYGIYKPFARKVFKSISKVPYGKVISYREVAKNIGKKNSSRAVGNALSTNPVPIIIPCHRIIHSDGALGGFSAGINLKKKLLKLESIRLGK